MTPTPSSPARAQKGFTLIELLITILIIGILAAIGLAAYNGQRDKAKDAQAKTAVRNALTAARAYYTENETYAGFVDGTLTANESTLTDQYAVVTPGSSANPSVISFDYQAAGVASTVPSAAAPAGTNTLRLCSASKGTKVFCIADNASTGAVVRTSNTTQAAALLESANDW